MPFGLSCRRGVFTSGLHSFPGAARILLHGRSFASAPEKLEVGYHHRHEQSVIAPGSAEPQSAFQGVLIIKMRVGDLSFPVVVGMGTDAHCTTVGTQPHHHPMANDGNLDDEIVKFLGTIPRQRCKYCAALHLKHTYCVCSNAARCTTVFIFPALGQIDESVAIVLPGN